MQDEKLQFGTRSVWGDDKREFGFWADDLAQHAYVIGQSGTGKSTLLHNVAVQLMRQGYGVGVVDPHGSLIETMVHEVPTWRTNETVLFEPGNLDWSVGLNPLHGVAADRRDTVATLTETMFSHLWSDFWGPQSAYILRNLVGTLLDAPIELNPTLINLYRLLTDETYRHRARRFVTTPSVRQFWSVYESWDEKQINGAAAPLINKLDALTSSASLAYAFMQVRPRFDARTAMDRGQIVLCNLSKGAMGSEPSSIFGSVLVNQFLQAAYERSDRSEEERDNLVPFYLFCDEFQSFGAPATWSSIVSESRKAKLYLIAAHQFIAQLSHELRDAVAGNVGTVVSFRVGAKDAPFVAQQLGVPERRLLELDNYEALVQPMWGGVKRQTFKGKTVPPMRFNCSGRRDVVVTTSRRHFARRRWSLDMKRGVVPVE